MHIDLIGDIHGHADELELLLQQLGYRLTNNVYTHASRKTIFVGDYIDRGPKIPETLAIVKAMVDAGQAVALLGNHEYNAVCFNTTAPNGSFLRSHSIKNILQHTETLVQFQNNETAYFAYINWFKTLPLYYECDAFRAVHAAWDFDSIAVLKKHLNNACFTDSQWYESTCKNSALHLAVEKVLKGTELRLPDNLSFLDKDGNARHEIRTKWWLNPKSVTYKQISVLAIEGLPDTDIGDLNENYYHENQKPVFFGHYWLRGQPQLVRNNICCLDYSVAKKGYLVAYSFQGENTLTPQHFTYISCLTSEN